MKFIKSAADARAAIGKVVQWDDISPRYIFERSGIVEEVRGRNIVIDGDWLWRANLKNLRLKDQPEQG